MPPLASEEARNREVVKGVVTTGSRASLGQRSSTARV